MARMRGLFSFAPLTIPEDGRLTTTGVCMRTDGELPSGQDEYALVQHASYLEHHSDIRVTREITQPL
jgi:hypothetical protein